MALIEFKDLPDTSTPLTADNLNNNFDELLNELNEKTELQYCVATITSAQIISQNYTVNLQIIDRSQGEFSLVDGGIEIGSGIKKIRVSASIFVDNWVGSTNYLWGQILKNNNIITSFLNSGPSSFLSSSIPSTIIDVSEGDIIKLVADSYAGGTLRTGAENTYLCIERVD